jgi:hypothetical protein
MRREVNNVQNKMLVGMTDIESKLAALQGAAANLLPDYRVKVQGIKQVKRYDPDLDREYVSMENDEFMSQNLVGLIVRGNHYRETEEGIIYPTVIVPFTAELLEDSSAEEIAEMLAPKAEERLQQLQEVP